MEWAGNLMTARRMGAAGRLWRAVPVAVLLGVLAAGASAGPAAGQSLRAGRPATAAGTISTVAGGPGGPGRATTVAVNPFALFAHGSSLYIADAGAVRTVSQQSDWLTTVAGTGASGPAGDGGPATRADLLAEGVAMDQHGNLVVSDEEHHEIAVVAARTGTFYGQAMTAGHLYRVAGDGAEGVSTSGGIATRTPLGSSADVTVDAHGNLILADSGWVISKNQKQGSFLKVVAASTGTFYHRAMTAGHIYTVAGNGKSGFSGDGGPATRAALGTRIGAVQADHAGNLVFADYSDDRIRVVAARTGTSYGQAMTAGHIYTVAGDHTRGFSGDGGPATQAELDQPSGLAIDAAGNLVIADRNNQRVRVVATRNGAFYGQAMTAGDIYSVAGGGHGLGDGGPATSASLNYPDAVTIDGAGGIVIADTGDNRVRVVAGATSTRYGQPMTAGHIYTVAGNGAFGMSGGGGPATKAEFGVTTQLAVGGPGSVAFCDYQRVSLVAGASGTFFGRQMTAGDVYTVAGGGTGAANGIPATKAGLGAAGVAFDGAGNLLVNDDQHSLVRVVAAASGTFYGQAMTAGDIYTVAGDGKSGYSGDGGPATSAMIGFPEGLTTDGAGNLLIADTDNNRVRVVAAKTGTFYGIAMTAGHIYTVAGDGKSGYSGDGGPATSASMDFPDGVSADGAGNVLIADTLNYRVRVVAAKTGTFYGIAMTAGHIYTVAGDGKYGFSGDGGPATGAKISDPDGVTADAAGNLVIADGGNNRARVVAARAGTFYGIAMTTGHIYTVAGTGKGGFSGDGGPATSARIGPFGVAADGPDLMITDANSNRVRMVTGP
jgi:hypothetical protein